MEADPRGPNSADKTGHLPPSLVVAMRNFDTVSERLLHDTRNREPLPPEQLAAYRHFGKYQARLPPITDPRDLAGCTNRWLTTVVHSLAAALAAFAQAALLQPQPADTAATQGTQLGPTSTVSVGAAADHLRHVARAAQQLTAAIAVHLDQAPFAPGFYTENQDDKEEDPLDHHAKQLQPDNDQNGNEETC